MHFSIKNLYINFLIFLKYYKHYKCLKKITFVDLGMNYFESECAITLINSSFDLI